MANRRSLQVRERIYPALIVALLIAVISVALLIVAINHETRISPAFAVSVSVVIVALMQFLITRTQERQARYAHLASLWYDLKTKAMHDPTLIDPAYATLYRPELAVSEHSSYHLYAWMCWGHGEDCFLEGYAKHSGFLPSIERYKEWHWAWLTNDVNKEMFGPTFFAWVENDLLRPKVEPGKSSMKGAAQGLFADKKIYAGEFIGYFSGCVKEESSQMSVQFGPAYHVEPGKSDALRYLNHSCAPNAFFRGRNLYAFRKIEKGCEVTVDYNCSEEKIHDTFICSCGARGEIPCVGEVRGWMSLDESQHELRIKRAPNWLSGWQGGPGARPNAPTP